MQVTMLWVGSKTLPWHAVVSIKSFLAYGHGVSLYAYDELTNVPEGAEVKDGCEILPKESVYLDRHKSYATFADEWRWKFLADIGGVWVDTDVVCLTDNLNLKHPYWTTVTEKKFYIGVLAFDKGDPIAVAMRDYSADPAFVMPYDNDFQRRLKTAKRNVLSLMERKTSVAWEETGAIGLGKLVTHLGLDGAGAGDFYPVPYDNWRDLYTKKQTLAEATKGAMGLHLWACAYEFASEKPEVVEGSIADELRRKYLP